MGDHVRLQQVILNLVRNALDAMKEAQLTAHLITMGQLHRDNRYDRMTDTFQQ